jgi:hypothetical protein
MAAFSGNLLIHQQTMWRNTMKRREFIKKAGAGAIAAGAQGLLPYMHKRRLKLQWLLRGLGIFPVWVQGRNGLQSDCLI